MKLSDDEIRKAVEEGRKALRDNPEMKTALVYPQGFVPNAYKFRAPGQRVRVTPDSYAVEHYDRKRSRAKGSYITLWRNDV